MKNKKILAVGLCGAICLSLAGFTYANALASDAPKNLASETENTSGVDILYHDTDGGQISVDGKNWVAEADYEKNNVAPDVQWWTAIKKLWKVSKREYCIPKTTVTAIPTP